MKDYSKDQLAKNKEENELKNEEYFRILEYLKSIRYKDLLSVLNIKEATIFSLKFGLVDNKFYSNEVISRVLSVSEEEINDVVKKVILLFCKNQVSFTLTLENLEQKLKRQL